MSDFKCLRAPQRVELGSPVCSAFFYSFPSPGAHLAAVGRRFFVRFWQDEAGQGITEYILILMGAAWGAVQIYQALQSGFNQGVLTLGAELEKDLKTGRASLGVWQN